MKAKALFHQIQERLQPMYDRQEAQSIAFLLLSEKYGVDRSAVIAGSRSIEPSRYTEFLSDVERIANGEPVQYVIGYTYFHDLKIKVNSSTLIPRPETEELIDLIISENEGALKILDIGSGSGCIALALKSAMRDSDIYALDVSPEAVGIAIENSALNQLFIHCVVSDIFIDPLPASDFDIWVSNPPYVRESEKRMMHENVLKHEPHDALFVKDENPLIFYRIILEKGRSYLKHGGKIYFEINEAFGGDILALFSELGYCRGRALKDINGKDRMASAEKD